MALQLPETSTTVRDLPKDINDNAENQTSGDITVSTTSKTSKGINQGLERRGNFSASETYAELIKADDRDEDDRVKTLMILRPKILSLPSSRGYDSRHLCDFYGIIFDSYIAIIKALLQYADARYGIGRLRKNTTCHSRGRYGQALHVAVRKGSLNMMQLLLDKDAPIIAKIEDGIQVIHLAVINDSTVVPTTLITVGADVSCVDRIGWQPVHYISGSRDRPGVIEYLAQREALVDGLNGLRSLREPTPLHLACKKGFIRNLEALLGGSALATAIRHISPLSVELLSGRTSIRTGSNGGTAFDTFVSIFEKNGSA